MTIVFQDSFTGGAANLNTHTPDTGTGWTVSGGQIDLNGSGSIVDGNTSSGNRYNCSDDFGITEYDVGGDFTSTDGSAVFWGPRGRETSTTSAGALEFNFDRGVSGGSYVLGTSQATDTFSGTVTMVLKVRAGTASGFADGISKVTYTGDPNPSTGTFCGVFLGNFDAAAADMSCDNFYVDDLAGTGGAKTGALMMMGVGT